MDINKTVGLNNLVESRDIDTENQPSANRKDIPNRLLL
jgi:hypothetical protein